MKTDRQKLEDAKQLLIGVSSCCYYLSVGMRIYSINAASKDEFRCLFCKGSGPNPDRVNHIDGCIISRTDKFLRENP